ncbi:nicotinamide N-methyltransferase-like [Paramuricea clavata]|uniref:Nicotinamide N-methyltransferase-like n=1 Tax=Paramuricea clavata TaxID=317549 RepID=A0A6S7ILI5_PARCT|nr:nicotinamide N-methyltransferase-like [Paramuricea clavata]
MANMRSPEDYHAHFDPKTFLEQFYKNFKVSVSPIIEALHEFWSNFKAPTDTEPTKVRYLEFGGGPSIMSVIFASRHVDHIVFSEYTEANRQAVKSWIAGDPDAHDWMPLIEIVVLELEQGRGIVDESGESSADKEKLERVLNAAANEVKRKIKSIVPCDVNKAPIVQLDGVDVAKPFDVVSTSLCLESCVSSEAHYKSSVAELCKFLKPNGYLFMNGVLEETYYYVGEEKFYNFPLTEKMVKAAMIEAGIEIEKFVAISDIPVDYAEPCDATGLFYTYGRKSVEK